jgi:hypothetical protein
VSAWCVSAPAGVGPYMKRCYCWGFAAESKAALIQQVDAQCHNISCSLLAFRWMVVQLAVWVGCMGFIPWFA